MDKQKQIENFSFTVIDNNTGKEADIGKIALEEDWAKDLMYCDMQGFALLENGSLVLLDECGKYEYCPSDRFTIIPENAVVLTEERNKIICDRFAQLEKVQAELQELNAKYYNEAKDLRRELKRVRKETAEKFAERVKNVISNEWTISSFVEERLFNDIDEICKEITEGK